MDIILSIFDCEKLLYNSLRIFAFYDLYTLIQVYFTSHTIKELLWKNYFQNHHQAIYAFFAIAYLLLLSFTDKTNINMGSLVQPQSYSLIKLAQDKSDTSLTFELNLMIETAVKSAILYFDKIEFNFKPFLASEITTVIGNIKYT